MVRLFCFCFTHEHQTTFVDFGKHCTPSQKKGSKTNFLGGEDRSKNKFYFFFS